MYPAPSLRKETIATSFEVPKSPLCPSQWRWILSVEFYFWMPEAQRGKVTCLKFQFVSGGATDPMKSPSELGGESDSIWPSTYDEGWTLASHQALVISDISDTSWCLEQAVLCPRSLSPSALAYTCNPLACHPARVSSSSPVLQRSPQARSQLDAGDSSSRHMGMYLRSFLWLHPGAACEPLSVSALGHLLVTWSEIQSG